MSNCNCKEDIEARLLDRFKASSPEASEHTASLTGYGMVVVDNTLVLIGFMPIELSASLPMKGGTLRKRKKFKQSMFFNYCPFCGEKIKEGAA